jgi:hypothetical protein
MKTRQILSVKRMRVALLALICIATTRPAQAQSVFSGVLLATNGTGIVAGTVQLTVNGGHVTFDSMLFQAWVANPPLAPVLEVQGDKMAFGLGAGTQGNWPPGQFIGPLPGQSMTPSPNPQFPNLEQMPGSLPLSAGSRFAGSFTAFPELENALLTSGGTISLRVKGVVEGVEKPAAVETLVVTSPRISNQFAAMLTGTNEAPPLASPHHGNGSFTLDGSSLIYDLALDAGFRPTRASVFGPAASRSNQPAAIADLRHYIAAGPPGDSGMVIYRGQLNLTGEAVEALRRGELYVNVFSPQHPRGELRGSILPIPVPVPNAPGDQPVITVAPR